MKTKNWSYGIWYDESIGDIVTYSRHWKKADWQRLSFVGWLQGHQQRFKVDEGGRVYRILYGKRVYYSPANGRTADGGWKRDGGK